MSRGKSVAFWATTGIVALILTSGGLFQVMGQSGAVLGITSIGYPVYFVTILGVWKFLGGIAIAMPRTPRLKEWAYAGAFFDFSGAAASHAAHHSFVGHVIWPGALAALTLISWALRPESRVLGTVFPTRA